MITLPSPSPQVIVPPPVGFNKIISPKGILLFAYGTILLPENLLRFDATPLQSVFVQGYEIEVNKSPVTKTNYHYLHLVKTDNNNIVPGILVAVNKVLQLDQYELPMYHRVPVICYSRRLRELECFAYLKL